MSARRVPEVFQISNTPEEFYRMQYFEALDLPVVELEDIF